MFRTYQWIFNKSNKRNATSGAGTTYLIEHSNPPQFSSGIRVARSLVFCVVFCGILSFCIFSFAHCIVSPSVYIFCLPSLISSNFSQYYYAVCSCWDTTHKSIILAWRYFSLNKCVLWFLKYKKGTSTL
jgi:hypothetical protein